MDILMSNAGVFPEMRETDKRDIPTLGYLVTSSCLLPVPFILP